MISYEWLDLDPFTPTMANLHQIGAMLGRLHDSTRGVEGFAQHDLDAEIADRAAALDQVDAETADRVRALHARWGPTNPPAAQV